MSDQAIENRSCACGASLRVSSVPGHLARDLASVFDGEHTGAGHRPATPAQAARARRKADSEAAVAAFRNR